MSRAPILPERLRYLQPFRRKFQGKQNYCEELAMETLIELIGKHIQGLSDAEAASILGEDLSILREWLARPEAKNDCLHFATGVALVASPDQLVTLVKEELEKWQTPPPDLVIDFPATAKVKRLKTKTEAALIVRWNGLISAISVVSEESAAKGDEYHSKIVFGVETTPGIPVQFGSVVGKKFVQLNTQFGQKSLTYILSAPGGYVDITVSPISKKVDPVNWDESLFEKTFHTIRIT